MKQSGRNMTHLGWQDKEHRVEGTQVEGNMQVRASSSNYKAAFIISTNIYNCYV